MLRVLVGWNHKQIQKRWKGWLLCVCVCSGSSPGPAPRSLAGANLLSGFTLQAQVLLEQRWWQRLNPCTSFLIRFCRRWTQASSLWQPAHVFLKRLLLKAEGSREPADAWPWPLFPAAAQHCSAVRWWRWWKAVCFFPGAQPRLCVPPLRWLVAAVNVRLQGHFGPGGSGCTDMIWISQPVTGWMY